MCVNDKLYRMVRFACDMYIEDVVPKNAPPYPTGTMVVDGVMKKAKIKKLDLDIACYHKLIRRADKQLKELEEAALRAVQLKRRRRLAAKVVRHP